MTTKSKPLAMASAQALLFASFLHQAYSIHQLLRSWLAPGGPVPLALDPSLGPLHRLPHTLGEHCATCKAAPRCWADTATRGSLPLAGVTATQAAALEAAGVTNVRELAAAEARGVRAPGILPHELRRMAFVASKRLQWHERALAAAAGAASGGQGSGQEAPAQGQLRQQAAVRAAPAPPPPPFALLPGAGRTVLPPYLYTHVCSTYPEVVTEVRPLTRVYMAVGWDSVLRRVAVLAAHVASLRHEEAADIVEVVRAPVQGVGEAGWSPLGVPDTQWDEAEAQALSSFVQRLVEHFEAVKRSRSGALAGDVRNHYYGGIAVHFYFNAWGELVHVVSRCKALVTQLEKELAQGRAAGCEGAGGAEGAARVAQARRQAQLLRFLWRLLTMHPSIQEECQEVREGPLAGQGMVSVVEEELARYATPWLGAGLQAATSVDWMGEGPGRLFNWKLERPAGEDSSSGGGSESAKTDTAGHAGGHTWEVEEGRLVSGLYTRSVWPVGRQGQAEGQQQEAAGRVQLRPDIPGAHLPPSLIWRAWQHGEEGLLTGVLQRRAHALRWLEERLLLQEPSGFNRQVYAPGLVPDPDYAHLIKRQLNLGLLLSGCDWDGGVVGVPGEGQGPVQGAVEVCIIERASELAQFRGELLRTPPAVRAGEGRGALVLGSLRAVWEGGKEVLVGRVLWPQGCSSWQELEEATGLAQRESVLLTLAGPDPGQCQGPEYATAQRSVLAQVLEGPAAAAGGGGVWVALHQDRTPYPEAGMPLRGTPGLGLHGLLALAGPGGMLVADMAPNISSWVDEAVLTQLRSAMADSGGSGGGGGSLLDRLTLPADLASAAAEDEEDAAGPVDAAATAGTAGPAAAAGGHPAPPPMQLLAASRPLDVDQEEAVRTFAVGPTAGPLAPTVAATSKGIAGNSNGNSTDGGSGSNGFQGSKGIIMLLQGPPGTGKTETAATAVLQWLAAAAAANPAGGLVLVSGPTHAAINVALVRLADLLQQAAHSAGWRLRGRVRLMRVGKEGKAGPNAAATNKAMRDKGITMVTPDRRQERGAALQW